MRFLEFSGCSKERKDLKLTLINFENFFNATDEEMKFFGTISFLIILVFLSANIHAQDFVTFDDQGWNNNQTLSSSFTADNYTYSSNIDFYTNYGYNFDVNSNSIYYVFQNPDSDIINITTANNALVELNSVDAYQVSETSTDTLVIEGWKDSNKLYSKSFYGVYSWQTLNLNYENINKVVIKVVPATSTQLTDYNFDNFSFTTSLMPVELTTFDAVNGDNGIDLTWRTATEVNNYGFEIERASSHQGWTKIGFVNGAGTSNSPKSYSFTDNSVSGGNKYEYRLKQIDNDGKFIYSKVLQITANISKMNYALSQNYPNPFNPSTAISYQLSANSYVTLKVYDMLGNLVKTLVNGYKNKGKYKVNFHGNNLASGVYIYKLNAGSFNEIKKMMLLK